MSHASSQPSMDRVSLDDLYGMTAYIFSEQNSGRMRESTFAHFIEVCGMLSSLTRNKARGEVDFVEALCKALGWFFPLMAQFGVASVERLIFRKYPSACPYCRMRPHQDTICKSVRGLRPGVLDHNRLRQIYQERQQEMPESLDSWQRMFQEIYPRTIEDRDGRSALGLMEELGELAEAIRVFDEHPKFFAGEAADVFSYIMGFANEYSLRLAQQKDESFSFETEYMIRYPGMCIECGFHVCRCPHIPEATVGRMAKELDIETPQPLFGTRPVINVKEARQTAELALKRAGGYSSIILSRFPFDRGDANRSVVQGSLEVAEQLESSDPGLADTVRGIAIRLSHATTDPGAREHSADARQLIGSLVEIFGSPAVGKGITTEAIQDSDLGAVALPKKLRVLVASSKPNSEDGTRPEVEVQVIADAIQRSRYRERIDIVPVVATQFDHLRRVLLDDGISVVHFAGHGLPHGLAFEDVAGNAMIVSLETLREYLARFTEIECVVLNACYSLKDISQPVGRFTVGMEESLSDDAAREFARGFYDALGAGKDYDFAVKEGCLTAKAKGYGDVNVKVLEANSFNGLEA